MKTAFAGLLLAVPVLAEHPREPVPAGALLRLGTTRFRSEETLLRAFYSRDGHSIYGCTQTDIVVWDADSGLKARTIPCFEKRPDPNGNPGNGFYIRAPFAYDAGGERLACCARVGDKFELQIWDLKAGKKSSAEKLLPSILHWTPAGRLVLVVANQGNAVTVRVRDASGADRHQWSAVGLSFDDETDLCVLDDRRMAFIGEDSTLTGCDLETGQNRVKFGGAIAKESDARVAASRDGRLVALATEARCLVYEVATGREVAAIEGDAQSPGGAVRFAPDGGTVYYSTRRYQGFASAGGKPLFDLRLDSAAPLPIEALSPDGRRVLCHNGQVIHQADARTGREIDPLEGHEPAVRLVWLPDGKTLLARANWENSWSAWNLESGRRVRRFGAADPKLPGWSIFEPIHLAPTGRELFDFNAAVGPDSRGVAFDIATGAVRPLFPNGHAVKPWPEGRTPRVPADDYNVAAYDGETGRVLVYQLDSQNRRRQYRFSWWNLATGLPESRYALGADGGEYLDNFGGGPYIVRNAQYDDDEGPPNPYARALRIHGAGDGRLLRILDHADVSPLLTSASADYQFLLTASSEVQPRPGPQGDVPKPPGEHWHLWELASGRELARWPKPADAVAELEPRGRYVVQSAAGTKGFRIYEPCVLRKSIAELPTPSMVLGFSFSPDGRRLATLLADTTIVIWDTAPWEAAIARELAAVRPADLGILAAQLKDAPEKANAAARLLATAGDRAVAVLKGSVEPAKPGDANLLRRGIADLDAPGYAPRERASRELARQGYRAETALRSALASKPSAEKRFRLEALLAPIDGLEYDEETLRGLRAVQVLKEVGSPAARELLAALAKGDAAAPLTRAASGK